MVAFFGEPKTNLIGAQFLSLIHPLIQFSPVTDPHLLPGSLEYSFVVQIQRLSILTFFC